MWPVRGEHGLLLHRDGLICVAFLGGFNVYFGDALWRVSQGPRLLLGRDWRDCILRVKVIQDMEYIDIDINLKTGVLDPTYSVDSALTLCSLSC